MASVLIVDDSNLVRFKCYKLLLPNGYDIIEARDGIDAIGKYQLHHPDIVLMDIAMPQMDGIRALKEIIKIDHFAKVAMLSALGQKAMVIRAIRAGAKSFIVKPFISGKVLDTVQRLVAG